MADPAQNTPSIEQAALKSIRNFSLLSMTGYLILTIAFLLLIALPVVVYSIISPASISTSALTRPLISLLAAYLSMIVAGSVILVIAIIPLRWGYGDLKKISEDFSLPYTGTTLYFVGLILVVLGVLATMVSVLVFPRTPSIFGSLAIAVIGGIMVFIGGILTLIVGAFRLDRRYGGFTAPAVLFILGLFFSLFSFVAVIIMYNRTTREIRKLSAVGPT
ncbi:MAG: DUF973 family protein [Thermoplasmata archaeon]